MIVNWGGSGTLGRKSGDVCEFTGRAASSWEMLLYNLLCVGVPSLVLPPALRVENAIDGDALFNVSMGTPGSCSCESPACNVNPATGTRLMMGDVKQYAPDGCEYYSIGGGIAVSATGNPCAIFRADNAGCTFNPASPTGECSRVANISCDFSGTSITLHAAIDMTCDTLPYGGCDPASSKCCGADNVCALAPPSTTYHMCQPIQDVVSAEAITLGSGALGSCDQRHSTQGTCGADNATICGEPGKCCVPHEVHGKCGCNVCMQ